MLRYSSCSC